MDEFEMCGGEGRRKLAPLHLLMKSNPSPSISHKSSGKSQGLRESDNTGDIITQMPAEWARPTGTMTGTIVPLALTSHLETYMEKK